MKKGILMEINEGYLTLMTPDGEFLRARKQNQPYIIGEEIVFFPLDLSDRNKHFSFLKRIMAVKPLAAAAFALILFIGSFLTIQQNNKAYAYMSIDVNPSIELALNKKMQVLKMTAFNQDGKKIMANLGQWKKENIATITQKLLKEMGKQGYLKDHYQIVISTVRTEKKEQSAEKVLTENIKEIEQTVKGDHLKLTLVNGSKDDLEKAHQLGITAGKYKEKDLLVPHETKSVTPKKELDNNTQEKQIPGVPAVPKPTDPAQKQPDGDRETLSTPAVHPQHPASQNNGNGHSAGNRSGAAGNSAASHKQERPQTPGQLKKIDDSQEKLKDIKDTIKYKVHQEFKQEGIDQQSKSITEELEKKTLRPNSGHVNNKSDEPFDIQMNDLNQHHSK